LTCSANRKHNVEGAIRAGKPKEKDPSESDEKRREDGIVSERIPFCLCDRWGSVGNSRRLPVSEAWRLRISVLLVGSPNSSNFRSGGSVGSHPASPGSSEILKARL
jgi:hypothetical protein